MKFALQSLGIHVAHLHRNLAPATLYEIAIQQETGTSIVSSGALAVSSGRKTGRSPADKRIVFAPESSPNIWWGDVNIALDNDVFSINVERAIDYFNTRDQLYVFDGFAGWDPDLRIKVRVVCVRPYHALFMHNMLIRPSTLELEQFGEPDFTILNAGPFPANRFTKQMTSDTSIDMSFEHKCMVILGTEYAGEMKKGVFSLMNYLMPRQGVLSMHCSANEGTSGDVTLFFGLSGTGKTTLSADPERKLIGDDEHCWSDTGISNIEGGCYAKCINLDKESEPEIYDAIRFGTVLENVVFDAESRDVLFADASLTENTRAAYPLEYIRNAKIPAISEHPKNIIFLTCDAFGVLPPVSRLSTEQAMYHFLSGYTAKIAGTEQGVTEPKATFSACFGAAFLVWPPKKYAELLAEHMQTHHAQAWLINTGWIGGSYGIGRRISLKYTRAIIDAIHSGDLLKTEFQTEDFFNLDIPISVAGVPSEVLHPRAAWSEAAAYDKTAEKLRGMFEENYKKIEGLA